MHEMHVAAGMMRRRGRIDRSGSGRLPRAEHFFDLLEHGIAREIADHDEKRVRGRIIVAIEFRELFVAIGFDLRFGGSDDGVRMLAEEDMPQALGGEE